MKYMNKFVCAIPGMIGTMWSFITLDNMISFLSGVLTVVYMVITIRNTIRNKEENNKVPPDIQKRIDETVGKYLDKFKQT